MKLGDIVKLHGALGYERVVVNRDKSIIYFKRLDQFKNIRSSHIKDYQVYCSSFRLREPGQ